MKNMNVWSTQKIKKFVLGALSSMMLLGATAGMASAANVNTEAQPQSVDYAVCSVAICTTTDNSMATCINMQSFVAQMLKDGKLTAKEAETFQTVEAKINALYEQADKESDETKAEALYQQIERLLEENGEIYDKVYTSMDEVDMQNFIQSLVKDGTLTAKEAETFQTVEAKINALYEQADKESDETKAEALYQQAESIMEENASIYDKVYGGVMVEVSEVATEA